MQGSHDEFISKVRRERKKERWKERWKERKKKKKGILQRQVAKKKKVYDKWRDFVGSRGNQSSYQQ